MDAGIIVSGLNIERHLKKVSDEIEPAINGAIRHDAPRLEAAAREAAFTIRLRGSSGKRATDVGLRRALAAAVGVRYEHEAVVFVVQADRMPEGKEHLPLVTVQRVWRHPVFGNRKVWVEQRGDVAWFQRAIHKEADQIVPNDILKALRGLG